MAAVVWSDLVTAACARREQARFAVFGGTHSEQSIARFLHIFGLDELAPAAQCEAAAFYFASTAAG
jgi:hypothetical protein